MLTLREKIGRESIFAISIFSFQKDDQGKTSRLHFSMRCTANGLRQKIASLVRIGEFFAHHVSRQSRPFFAFDGRENALMSSTLFIAGGEKIR